MFRTLGVLAAIFAVALAGVGLTFRASVERPADFRFINGTEPKSLDPHIMTGQPEGRIGDATLSVDDEPIYTVKRAKVGLFRDLAYRDYPQLSENARGGRLDR